MFLFIESFLFPNFYFQTKKLTQVGGSTLQLMIKKILNALFEEEFLSTYNWSGKAPAHIKTVFPKRKAFKDLPVLNIVKREYDSSEYMNIYQKFHILG